MNRKFSRTATAFSFAAALTMAATPALARDRHWGGGGRHNDRVDAGDIFAGVLILGGIAAIASAASSSNKAKRERERARDYQYPDQSYPQQSYPQRDNSAGYGNDSRPSYNEPGRSSRTELRGLDSAVDRCASEIERGDRRIDVIDTVAREGDGWRVAGRITSGPSFACTVDRDGRVSNVNLDGRAL